MITTDMATNDSVASDVLGRLFNAVLAIPIGPPGREGLVKMAVHPDTGQIMGVHLLAPQAGELIHTR